MNGEEFVIELVVLFVAGFLTASVFAALAGHRQEWSLSRTVHEWEQGLLYVDGRFVRALEPGRYRTVGLRTRQVVTMPCHPGFETVPLVEATSADRLSYRLAATIRYRIADPRAAHEGNHRESLRHAVSEALVQLAAARTVEAVLAERAGLGTAVLTGLAPEISGCRIEAVAVSAVTLPPELRRLYAEIERARLEGQAALERARGEQAALRSLANAARMLKGNPELMNLRLLQALSASGGKGGATLVLGREAFASTGDGGGSAQDA